ncbi:6-phospho-beta-glucosidase [Oribacterium sp. KHPX15]|nr:6-phospho-beta-glucosidase [Oribacterium sp. KHPX15]
MKTAVMDRHFTTETYMKYCTAIFTLYKNLVKYWITFNEINMLLHMSFMGAGIFFKEGEDRQTVLYNAAHHELLASAKPVKLAHEMIPGGKIGCMLAAGQFYPYSPNPEDIWDGFQKDRDNYFFIDVQARGSYPVWAWKRMEEAGRRGKSRRACYQG